MANWRMAMGRLRRVLSVALSGLALSGVMSGCRQPAATGGRALAPALASARTFQVKGVVQEIKPGTTAVVIKHEEIPGYMPAMTMPFEVKEARQLADLKPGDTVSFRLVVTETDGWIEQVQRLESGPPPTPKPEVESVRVARIVDELSEGDLMPDYAFQDEQGRPIRLSQFRGQALGFTFFYTRCPYPTFCPRLSRQFAEACAQLQARTAGPTNWHLLSISFDPAHDTPPILHAYAKTYGYNPARWNFLTGQMIDIDAITEQFGMFFARDGDSFSHNVRTVVVNAQGRIQRILIGNNWEVAEFVAEMVKAAAGR